MKIRLLTFVLDFTARPAIRGQVKRSLVVAGGAVLTLAGGYLVYAWLGTTGVVLEDGLSPVAEDIRADTKVGSESTRVLDPSSNRGSAELSSMAESSPDVAVAPTPAPSEPIAEDSCNYGPLPWDGYLKEYLKWLQVPKTVWEDKYFGYDESDLAAAQGRVRAEFFKTANRELEIRRAAGDAVRFEAKYTVDDSGNEKMVPFKLTKSGNIPYHTVWGYPASGEEGAVYEFNWLPPDEYPDFYLLASETMWLTKQVPDH